MDSSSSKSPVRLARLAGHGLLAVAVGGMAMGCSVFDTRLPDDPRLAYLITGSHAYEYKNSPGMVETAVSLDGGKPSGEWRIGLSPGRHRVRVLVTWPGEYREETWFPIDAAAGHRYGVGAFYLAQNQRFSPHSIMPTPPPTKADHAATLGVDFARLVMVPIAAGGAVFLAAAYLLILPISLPLTLMDLSKQTAPQQHLGRPFEGCCAIWIEDMASGQIVAGAQPAAQPSPPRTPAAAWPDPARGASTGLPRSP